MSAGWTAALNGIAVGYSTLFGFAVMLYSYDYISCFVPFFNIAVSLRNLFQRISFIYDRFYFSRLYKYSVKKVYKRFSRMSDILRT